MISEKEYKQRRDKLANSLKKNSVAVVFSAKQKIRSNDTEYPYRQDSNFYYLTGFKEDNATLVLLKDDKTTKSYMFVQKKDKQLELWTGKRLGVKKAKKIFDVDDVFEDDKKAQKLKELFLSTDIVYYDFKLDYSDVKLIKRYTKDVSTYKNIAKKIEKMRLIKSDSEIELIKKAISITKEAHHRSMAISKKLHYEYQLQAEIEYIFKKEGAYSDAYTSIVASGNNANTLHYISNDKPLKATDLILIDAGCEYNYYASDITRTIPVSGRFTKEQKDIYNLVLDVQKKVIKMIKPDVLRSDLQKYTQKMLCSGLVELGILHGDVKKLLKKGVIKKYYPHGIGHWMGLDVHDSAPYKDKKGKEIPLKDGMVLTIEPGLYLSKDDKDIPKCYRGIGVRIEDDILVTKDGCINLSSAIAKEIKDIEAIGYKSSSNL